MGKYVNRITHKGRDILVTDISAADDKKGVEAFEELRQQIAKEPDGCLMLVDCTNLRVSLPILTKAKETAESFQGNPRYPLALVGLTGAAKSTGKVHVMTRRLNAHFSDTMEEGKEWLVKEAEKLRKG